MSSLFNYDWFTGPAFELQRQLARERCARKKFPHLSPEACATDKAYQAFYNALEIHSIVYLRDGFSYQLKNIVDIGLKGMLTFECEPVDEQYKVAAFVVSLPFDEIVRVEVFAVHPSEKPDDVPLITGFRTSPDQMPPPREDIRE